MHASYNVQIHRSTSLIQIGAYANAAGPATVQYTYLEPRTLSKKPSVFQKRMRILHPVNLMQSFADVNLTKEKVFYWKHHDKKV